MSDKVNLKDLGVKVVGLIISTYFISNLYFQAITSSTGQYLDMLNAWPFYTFQIFCTIIGLYLVFWQKKE